MAWRSRALHRQLATAVFLTFAAAPIAGQKTGQLSGAVRDDRQWPLPGVTVTLSTPAVAIPRSVVTNGERVRAMTRDK